MAELPYDKCLLISCQAMHYFTNAKLLQKKNGQVLPADGAEQVAIDKVLEDVKKDDDDFGLHGIDTILDQLVERCDKEGFNLAMSAVELLDKTIIFNIKSLTRWINANATPKQ